MLGASFDKKIRRVQDSPDYCCLCAYFSSYTPSALQAISVEKSTLSAAII